MFRRGGADRRGARNGAELAAAQRADAFIASLRPAARFSSSKAILGSGNVATVPNRFGADVINVSAGTLAAPAADARFGGAARSILFTGSQWLDSDQAPAFWAFMHNQYEVVHVFAPTDTSGPCSLSATNRELSSANGHNLYYSATATRQTISNSSSLLTTDRAFAFTVDVPTILNAYYDGSPSQAGNLGPDGTGTTSTPTYTPNAGDPLATFRLGAFTNGTVALKAAWVDTIILDRVLTTQERRGLRLSLKALYPALAVS